MPEGPTIYILKEELARFAGKKMIKVSGNADIDMSMLRNQKLVVRVWGKQLFIIIKEGAVRIHFLLFGSYSVDKNTKPKRSIRLSLEFLNGSVYFYTCSVKFIPGSVSKMYNWKADVMSKAWDPKQARKSLKAEGETMICDALLNQEIFSGVGNIIKNEVLYRLYLHPETLVKNIPARKLSDVIREARNYSFDFLRWKKEGTLKQHWLAYSKKVCSRCDIPMVKTYTGKTKRKTFFCENCQVLYS